MQTVVGRTARVAIVSAVVAAAGVFGITAPAFALPVGCKTNMTSRSFSAKCDAVDGGNGYAEYRARVLCENMKTGSQQYAWGAWNSLWWYDPENEPHGWSIATCPSGYETADNGIVLTRWL